MEASGGPGGPPAPLPRWRVFPVLALGTVMATLDISVVNIALPTLSRTFQVPLTYIEWVVLAYVLAITSLLLVMGRVADALGRRRVYGGGMAVFTLASALCAAAGSAPLLIAARVLQGVGAAMMSATSLALLTSSFPAGERGRAIGAFGAAVGVGLSLGPPLGGLVVEHASWRWIFVLNLPIGIATLAMLPRRLPPDPASGRRPALDPAAVLASAGALVALMLALSRGPATQWRGAEVPWLLGAGVALGAAFVAVEARSREPLVPVGVLRGELGSTLLLTLIGQALSIGVGFHMPLYLEEVRGLDAGHTGRWMAVLPLTALMLAPLTGRWSDRVGARPLTTAGLLAVAAGLATLATLGVAPGRGHLLAGLLVVGVGLGLFSVANSSALMGSVSSERLGLASGLQAAARNLGLAAGSAVTVALVASRFAAHGGGTALAAGAIAPAARSAFALATRDAYTVLAALALAGAGIAWRRRSGRRRPDLART